MSDGQILTAACKGRGKLEYRFHRRGRKERKEIKNQGEKGNGKVGMPQTAHAPRYLTIAPVCHFQHSVREAVESPSRSVFSLLAACLID